MFGQTLFGQTEGTLNRKTATQLIVLSGFIFLFALSSSADISNTHVPISLTHWKTSGFISGYFKISLSAISKICKKKTHPHVSLVLSAAFHLCLSRACLGKTIIIFSIKTASRKIEMRFLTWNTDGTTIASMPGLPAQASVDSFIGECGRHSVDSFIGEWLLS